MRDAQRSKVYRWQNAAFNGYRVNIDEYTAEQLVRRYLTGIRVRFNGKRTASASAYYAINEIRFPRAGRGLTREVVLHEVAHILNRQKWGMEVQSHGRQYVRILMDLLVEHGYDRTRLANYAILTGVRF